MTAAALLLVPAALAALPEALPDVLRAFAAAAALLFLDADAPLEEEEEDDEDVRPPEDEPRGLWHCAEPCMATHRLVLEPSSRTSRRGRHTLADRPM